MIRVLVAEDSTTVRELLVEMLRADPECQVVGQASNGMEAVEKTKELQPDVVTMDIHMPRMNGFDATKQIMIESPTPIVIVTASLDPRDVETSMHALRAGALTVLAKPQGPGSPDFEEACSRFLTTVKLMSQVKVVRHWRERPRAEVPCPRAAPGKGTGRIIAIASSTGGPGALSRMLSELPGDLSVPVVVVQHIASGFGEGFVTWLNSTVPLKAKLAEQGEPLVPGTVYVAPDDKHLGVSARTTALLSTAPPLGGFRPSGTFLFESVAKAFGSSTIAVILTGMGQDGVEGLRQVREAGGQIIAQDEESSVVFGMPKAAIATGFVDYVLPLTAIAPRLLSLIRGGNGP